MRAKNILAPLLGCTVLVTAADADFLDRVKRKLDDAKSETQEVRSDVDAVTRADERIEGAANGAVPNSAQIDGRAAAEIENTESVQAVREAQRDANAVATADERAQAQVQGEIGAAQREVEATLDVEARARGAVERTEPVAEARQTQREVESALDVETRARGAVERTEPVAEARETQREVDAVLTADERVKLELQRERTEIERAADLD